MVEAHQLCLKMVVMDSVLGAQGCGDSNTMDMHVFCVRINNITGNLPRTIRGITGIRLRAT